jgi:hypothetical protein
VREKGASSIIVIGIVVVVVAVASVAAIGAYYLGNRGGGGGGGYKELTLDCPLPQVPLSVPRLKVVYQDVAPEEIRGLAEGTFGFTGNLGETADTENDVGCLYIEDSGQQLWMFNSGAIAYTSGKGGILYLPENLPSYEQAREIAENFMQEMEGLIPSNYSVQFRDVGPAEISYMGGTQIIHSLSVGFDLLFNGVKTCGGDVHVRMGENGEILAFGGKWRRVEVDGNTAITVTSQQAVETLKSGRFSALATKPEKAVIKSMELTYYIRSQPFMKQDTLTPVYLFKIAPIEADGSEGGLYEEMVPATDEPFTL